MSKDGDERVVLLYPMVPCSIRGRINNNQDVSYIGKEVPWYVERRIHFLLEKVETCSIEIKHYFYLL